MVKIITVGIFGMQVQPFHLVSLALHIANVWLLFIIARRLLLRCADDFDEKFYGTADARRRNPRCIKRPARRWVIRGGGWDSAFTTCRAAFRSGFPAPRSWVEPDKYNEKMMKALGLRLAFNIRR